MDDPTPDDFPAEPAENNPSPVRVVSDRRRGRGAVSNASGRFEPHARTVFDDGWESLEDLPPFKTFVQEERARKVITRNESPDLLRPLDQSLSRLRAWLRLLLRAADARVIRGCRRGSISRASCS
jgi:hypothetical protein